MIEYNASEQTEIPEANGFSVKIIGVGGSGANVLDRMALEGSEAGDLLTINTDVRALSTSVSSNKIQLGKQLLMGMGAGGDPELGREASLEAEDEIRAAVRGYSMVFVCVGLGGGTGSGAAPEVCRIAREEGAFLVTFTSLPFSFEGKRRMQQATNALVGIGEYSNAVVTFENDRMGELIVAKEGIQQAFAAADKLISQSILATTNMVTQPGIIRLGMDDLLTALRNRDSRCLFGFGQAKGDNRAKSALAKALKSPLIDKTFLLESAENVLIHISGGDSLTLYEVEILMSELAKHVSDQAQILFGVGTDKKLGNSLAVTLISSVSSEKIGPPGGGKASEDKKKALSDEADSGGDGDDDGGGGGSGSGDKESESGGAVQGVTDAAPPPGEGGVQSEPGAELWGEGVDSIGSIQPEASVDEPEWAPLGTKEDQTGEGSAEISSAASVKAADEISAEEEAKKAKAEEEARIQAEEEAKAKAEEEARVQAEEEAKAKAEEEARVQAEEEAKAKAEEEARVQAEEEEKAKAEEEARVKAEEEEKAKAEEEARVKEEEEAKAKAGKEAKAKAKEEAKAKAKAEKEAKAKAREEAKAKAKAEKEAKARARDEAKNKAAEEAKAEEEARVKAEEEAKIAAEKFQSEPKGGSQGMASLLGLTPVDSADDGLDDLQPEEKPADSTGSDTALESEVEAEEPSPFEIDDEDEPEPAQQTEDKEEVKSSSPMSIRDLAKKSLQSGGEDSDEDELIVHELEESENDVSADEDDSPIVPLAFDEADTPASEPAVEKKGLDEVILSAATGSGEDQEITLSRVDPTEEKKSGGDEDGSESAESVAVETGEESNSSEHSGTVGAEADKEEESPSSAKGEPQRQGVLELEPTAKGRFAKTDPTIVDGQDLDVPTFLRARRD